MCSTASPRPSSSSAWTPTCSFRRGALARLIAYLKAHRDTRDLLHGPLLYDDLRSFSTHFAPEWRGGMYGTWATDPRGTDSEAEPFEIPMQGLGLFVCRRDAWPGFNPRLHGFGGEEGYMHEKVRRAGGRVLCLPFLRWVHRFGRSNGIQYRNVWEDRIRNYGLVHDELGWDLAPMFEHFREVAGVGPTERAARSLARELASPFHYFDAIYCLSPASATEVGHDAAKRFEQLGIAARVRRFDAIETPAYPCIGRALSHRAILDEADRHGFQNVLVLHEESVLGDAVLDELPRRLGEMAQRPLVDAHARRGFHGDGLRQSGCARVAPAAVAGSVARERHRLQPPRLRSAARRAAGHAQSDGAVVTAAAGSP